MSTYVNRHPALTGNFKCRSGQSRLLVKYDTVALVFG